MMANDQEQPPRAGGRPRSDDPLCAPVTAWVRRGEYDRLVKMASQREDKSLSALVRSLLFTKLR